MRPFGRPPFPETSTLPQSWSDRPPPFTTPSFRPVNVVGVTASTEYDTTDRTPMREAFRRELDDITDELVDMTGMVGSAMTRATTALLEADLRLADHVIAGDERIDAMRARLDERTVGLLALQQPVATDLRSVVTAMQMSSDLERMGDLARHVAKVTRRRHPHNAVPEAVQDVFRQMGQVATCIVDKTADVIAATKPSAATDLDQVDDDMDRLHRSVYAALLDGRWEHGTEAAVDLALLARYYERFADHAVSVARRVSYLATGRWDDNEQDASNAL